MSDILSLVTPLTKGIIWHLDTTLDPSVNFYKEIDYILNGLLTSNLKVTSQASSRLIIGNNFHHSIFVMIIQNINNREIESFLSLIKKELLAENDVIVINASKFSNELKNELKEIEPSLRFLNKI